MTDVMPFAVGLRRTRTGVVLLLVLRPPRPPPHRFGILRAWHPLNAQTRRIAVCLILSVLDFHHNSICTRRAPFRERDSPYAGTSHHKENTACGVVCYEDTLLPIVTTRVTLYCKVYSLERVRCYPARAIKCCDHLKMTSQTMCGRLDELHVRA